MIVISVMFVLLFGKNKSYESQKWNSCFPGNRFKTTVNLYHKYFENNLDNKVSYVRMIELNSTA